MEIVTGSTGEAHVTPIDDAVRNSNLGYYGDKVVFNVFSKFEAQSVTANLVRVFSGYGMNQGRLFKIGEGSYDDVTIENGQQGAKRADLIVARYTMDTQTGFEDISLAVIKGSAGQEYVDPSFTVGDINSGATLDEFPLYRVKINGIVIEDVEQMFTLLPDGGRLGFIEEKIDNHIADKENPHEVTKAQVGLSNVPNVSTNNQTPTYTEAATLENIASGEVLSIAFGKIKKAIATLINHVTNKSNPHEVKGSQLVAGSDAEAVPISKGGTGARTAAGALQALGIPSSVADAMAKNVYTDTTNDVILVSKGGTGKSTITQGKVLVGNGTSAPTEKGIDTTSGGTANSTDLITSGAVNSKVTEMQATFQAGVDTIYNAEVAQGVTPSASTPQALATGIGQIRNPFTIKIGRYNYNPYYPYQDPIMVWKVGKCKPYNAKITAAILSGVGNGGKPNWVQIVTINTSGNAINSYNVTNNGTQSGSNMIYNCNFEADANRSDFAYVRMSVEYDSVTGETWSRGDIIFEVPLKYYP